MMGEIWVSSRKFRHKLLNLINGHIFEHGYSPTFEELAQATGKAKSVIHFHMSAMRQAGLVNWQDGKYRTIVIL
jgi:SOS-response transcriptional repressor LexA